VRAETTVGCHVAVALSLHGHFSDMLRDRVNEFVLLVVVPVEQQTER
jgi:hypothetical protein